MNQPQTYRPQTYHPQTYHPQTYPLQTLAMALFLGLGLAVVFLAQPASAQCDNVSYRLWTPGGETWHRWGETVEVVSGQEGQIYVHVDSAGRNPYSTITAFGYPREMGVGGPKAEEVLSHVRMAQQNQDDKQSGRIRFTAQSPGQTVLGFRISSLQKPGTLDLVKSACRVGSVPIRVVPRGGGSDDGQGQGSQAERAAHELVQRLSTALLRRTERETADAGFVRNIAHSGRDGVLQVADTMVSSSEFRRAALRRTEERHGRNNLETLRTQLLSDMYRDLYGYSEPDHDTQRDDLRDLEDCLGSSYEGAEACSRLGRELVGRRQFYDQHKELIDALGSGRPGRPGRR